MVNRSRSIATMYDIVLTLFHLGLHYVEGHMVNVVTTSHHYACVVYMSMHASTAWNTYACPDGTII